MESAAQRRPFECASAMKFARRMLDRGEVPSTPLIAPVILRSWERCLGNGLAPVGRHGLDDCLDHERLSETLEQHQGLLVNARPVMDYLYKQVEKTGSMVVLADHNGLLIDVLGEGDFMKRAARVSLQPGVSWHETNRGTNAIGTALAEAAPVVVHGAEHFLDDNRFLTCAAVPVMGSNGYPVGVIDISGHYSTHHAHTASLVRTAGHMIEHRLFNLAHENDVRLHIHPDVEGIGTLAEGLLALDGDGRITGANTTVLGMLGLCPNDIGHVNARRILAIEPAALQGALRSSLPFQITTANSKRPLAICARPGRLPSVTMHFMTKPAEGPQTGDALDALDTGDVRMARVVKRARKITGKPIAILLQGESGAGKERVAAAIHASGPRKNAPFVAVNCAALPEHLVESELFGYAPGAFTGARRQGSPGRIREANGGTLFLDEIGDMPFSLQSCLLRVLQEREVVPLGGGKAAKVDFALIAASHKPLRAEVEAGRFRADLYYRLNGLTLALPALRERTDFPALVSRMLSAFAPAPPPALAPDVLYAFAHYRWPGNLRQLANALQFACAVLDPGELTIEWRHLPDDLLDDLREQDKRASMLQCSISDMGRQTGATDGRLAPMDLPWTSLRTVSDAVIKRAIAASGGNMSEAARRLGISRNTLYRRLGTVSAMPDKQMFNPMKDANRADYAAE